MAATRRYAPRLTSNSVRDHRVTGTRQRLAQILCGEGAAGKSASIGPGEGPGGARLYRAEWVVEPTNAELSSYMPRGIGPGSSAEIACKTVENYRVENCRLLSESPMGSGLAQAMRLAAWQFKVRPPRIDGKPMVGAWVRIHFDFGTAR